MKKIRIIGIVCFIGVLAMIPSACTVKMPVSMDLQVQNAPSKKNSKRLCVVMSKEQSEKTFVYKKGDFADTFVFPAGKSIQLNLIHAMEAMFQEVTFTQEMPVANGQFEFYLLAEFKNAEVYAGALFGESKVNIFADYDLLDANSKHLTTISTSGNIERGYSGATKSTAIGVIFAPIAGAGAGMQGRKDIARMWDDAVALSLTQLMQELSTIIGP